MPRVLSANGGRTRRPLPPPLLLLLYVAPLLLLARRCAAAPSGPESDSCSTLVQNRFFGFFLSSAVFPATPCSWTLQNPDPRRYTVFLKVTKPSGGCAPSQVRTFQYDSFLETTRTYLGMESFDDVVKLCNASAPVAFLEAGKQFLQMRKGPPRATADPGADGEFKTEYLVVGKRNPSVAACQMLCQWLEDCLASSTSNRPCGIMQTPCLCWEPPPQLSEGDGCFHNGVYLENCLTGARDGGRGTGTKGEFWIWSFFTSSKSKTCGLKNNVLHRCNTSCGFQPLFIVSVLALGAFCLFVVNLFDWRATMGSKKTGRKKICHGICRKRALLSTDNKISVVEAPTLSSLLT